MGVTNPNQEESSFSNPQSTTYYGIPIQQPPPAYILLQPYPRRRSLRHCRCCSSLASASSLLTLSSLLLLLAISIFLLFPAHPQISVARLRLHHLHVRALPRPEISLSLSLKIRIRNRDFFSLAYRSLVVSIGYRGKTLGNVVSDGGTVRARGVSYVDADLKLDGIRVISDVFYLIADLANGLIPFDTTTDVEGELHVLFLDIPVAGRISCEVDVNPDKQTVVHQDCYPEDWVGENPELQSSYFEEEGTKEKERTNEETEEENERIATSEA